MKSLFALLFSALFIASFAQGPAPRIEAKIDQVINQYGLTGEGVLAVIIDRGIDYRHPDFIDENGNSRIRYIFDMIDQSGANDPDNNYGVGTIHSQEELNASLQAGTVLTNDIHGHGTATAGILGGNGEQSLNQIYQGVAPNVEYVIITLVHDYFPQFMNNPGQAGFFDPTYIPIALNFAFDKIEELQMPSVTLMNIGSTGGPTDGSSLICQNIDDFVNFGHPFVCGVGDDGGGNNHASYTLSNNETIELEINKGFAGNLRFDLWYSEEDRFTLSLELPNGDFYGPFAAPSGPNGANDQFFAEANIFHRGANVEFFGASSNRREILIDLLQNPGSAGVYKVILEGTSINDGFFHATLNPGSGFTNNEFLNYTQEGYSIADYSSCLNTISPTDYVILNEWTDLGGNFNDITGQGEAGEIWLGSSAGPTQDERLGVDFASPGEVCFAAYSVDSWYYFSGFNLVNDGNGFYGLQNAVSAAAPLTCGVIALMLEANPNLSPAQILDILQSTAIEDSFTGSTPNTIWGHGKLDALAAIEAALALVSVEDLLAKPAVHVFPNPAYEELRFELNQQMNIQHLEIVNLQGQIIKSHIPLNSNKVLNISELNKGAYLLRVRTEKSQFSQSFVKM
ncbi:MAG: S8 family peptidase [Bacteroidota bacterium]